MARPRRSSTSPAKKTKKASSDSSWSNASKEASESDWENDETIVSSASEEDDEYIEEPPKKKRATVAKKPSAQAKAVKPKRRKTAADFISSDEEFGDDSMELPTFARKTSRGGYTHTSVSRARISKANKGNTPWNKEKKWSDDIKAKIRSGVRARNQANLEAALKKIGMSLEEYRVKKKQIKSIREKVRKKKLAAAKHLEELNASQNQPEKSDDRNSGNDTGESDGEQNDNPACEESQKQASQEGNAESWLPHEIRWTPHAFDEGEKAYDAACPTGGPGGLICCETCAQKYFSFMSQTAREMEKQTASLMKNEVKELVGFLRDGRTQLKRAIQVTRKRPPPPRRAGRTNRPTGKSTAKSSGQITDSEWISTHVGNLEQAGAEAGV